MGILTTEWGSTVEGIGKVTKLERDSGRQPVAKAHPIEMCQKRAEGRARLMAYGPIPLPQRPMEDVIIEGEVVDPVEAAQVSPPAAPPPAQKRDLEQDIDELFPPDPWCPEDEPPAGDDARFDPETVPPPPLPDNVHSRGHFEQVLKDEGWTLGRLELQILKVPLDRYIREGHKLQDAYMAWRKHVEVATP